MILLEGHRNARTSQPSRQLPRSLPTDRPLGASEEPPLGAHLVTPRLGFTHHGIYAGRGQVIHYGSFGESLRRAPVEQIPVARFAHGHSVWIRTDRAAAFGRNAIVRRARSRMGEDRYSLLRNNCEHFCQWCVHGEHRSYQVERIGGVGRRTMKKLLACLATVLTAIFACTNVAHAQESDFYGLLRMRDLTPFGFLRLDMRPAHAVAIEKGTWAVEFDLGYQNTWALSPRVEDYLTALESQGRRQLGAADAQAIRELPGENYLLDFESATLDAIVHYKFSDDWAAYAILSGVSYEGGFLDSTIESFHDTFGFSSFGRPAVKKNDVNLIYDLKSAQVVSFGPPTDGGLLDPTIGVRYTGLRLPERWALSVEAAVKIPVDGTRTLLSSGHYDYGVQASLQRRSDHHALYANIGAVYYGGAEFPVPQDSQVIPTLIVGYEHRLTERTNLNVQAYVGTSVYSHDETDLDELTATKYEYSIGLRHRINHCLLTFGITENVQNVNNTPDIGFQLGFAYIPHPAQTR